nr:hypothetical protein [Tanacetum cinerariifolium]
MFDEYFKPPPNVDHPVPEVLTPVPDASTSSPSLTTVDQDVPSRSTSQTTLEQQSLVIPQEPSSKETTLEGSFHQRMLLAILLDRFRQDVNYKNMPFGAALMQITIQFHLVGNGVVEIYYLKGRIVV